MDEKSLRVLLAGMFIAQDSVAKENAANVKAEYIGPVKNDDESRKAYQAALDRRLKIAYGLADVVLGYRD